LEGIWENGFIAIENYATSDYCDACIADFEEGRNKYPQFVHHSDDIRLFGLENAYPSIRQFYEDPFLLKIANLYPNKIVQQVFTLVNKVNANVTAYGSGGCWHKDWFFHEIKAMLYLCDVTEENGPFELIKGSHRLNWIVKDIKTGGMKFKQNRLENEVDAIIQKHPDRHIVCTGKKGTLLLFDTSIIHRGKPLKSGSRYAMTNYYSDINIMKKVDYYKYMSPVITPKDIEKS